MARRFYSASSLDTVIMCHPDPFQRYGKTHTLPGPFTVRADSLGGFEVIGYVQGEMTYGGTLIAKVLQARTDKGRNVTFRTRREATAARDLILTSSNLASHTC